MTSLEKRKVVRDLETSTIDTDDEGTVVDNIYTDEQGNLVLEHETIPMSTDVPQIAIDSGTSKQVGKLIAQCEYYTEKKLFIRAYRSLGILESYVTGKEMVERIDELTFTLQRSILKEARLLRYVPNLPPKGAASMMKWKDWLNELRPMHSNCDELIWMIEHLSQDLYNRNSGGRFHLYGPPNSGKSYMLGIFAKVCKNEIDYVPISAQKNVQDMGEYLFEAVIRGGSTGAARRIMGEALDRAQDFDNIRHVVIFIDEGDLIGKVLKTFNTMLDSPSHANYKRLEEEVIYNIDPFESSPDDEYLFQPGWTFIMCSNPTGKDQYQDSTTSVGRRITHKGFKSMSKGRQKQILELYLSRPMLNDEGVIVMARPKKQYIDELVKMFAKLDKEIYKESSNLGIQLYKLTLGALFKHVESWANGGKYIDKVVQPIIDHLLMKAPLLADEGRFSITEKDRDNFWNTVKDKMAGGSVLTPDLRVGEILEIDTKALTDEEKKIYGPLIRVLIGSKRTKTGAKIRSNIDAVRSSDKKTQTRARPLAPIPVLDKPKRVGIKSIDKLIEGQKRKSMTNAPPYSKAAVTYYYDSIVEAIRLPVTHKTSKEGPNGESVFEVDNEEVYLSSDGDITCSCSDYKAVKHVCKHILASMDAKYKMYLGICEEQASSIAKAKGKTKSSVLKSCEFTRFSNLSRKSLEDEIKAVVIMDFLSSIDEMVKKYAVTPLNLI